MKPMTKDTESQSEFKIFNLYLSSCTNILFDCREESEPIGDGPIVNLDGEAFVKSSLGSQYRITIDDIQKLRDEVVEDA